VWREALSRELKAPSPPVRDVVSTAVMWLIQTPSNLNLQVVGIAPTAVMNGPYKKPF
jgi:hypothetical protein